MPSKQAALQANILPSNHSAFHIPAQATILPIKIIQIIEWAEQAEEALFGYECELDDKVCDRCRDYHGKTFTGDQVEVEFPYLTRDTYVWRPNVHPHCRCRLVRLVVIR